MMKSCPSSAATPKSFPSLVVPAVVAAAMLVVMVSPLGVAAQGSIRCNDGELASVCPNEAPVCCFYTDGSFAGCCQIGEVCDITTSECNNAPSLPPNATAVPLSDVTTEIHVSDATLVVVLASILSGLMCLGAIVFCYFWSRDKIEERRALLAEEARERTLHGVADEVVVSASQEAAYRAQLRLRQGHGPTAKSSMSDVSMNTTDTPPEAPHSAEAAASSPSTGSRSSQEGRGITGDCSVCSEAGATVLLFPCEHVPLCSTCAPNIRDCPICKRRIERRKKLFLE